MRFLVLIKAFESMSGPDRDPQIRQTVEPHIPRMMQSGMIVESGFLVDRRGAFLLVEVKEAIDLYRLLGPEVFGSFDVQAFPVASMEEGGAMFEEWGREGR